MGAAASQRVTAMVSFSRRLRPHVKGGTLGTLVTRTVGYWLDFCRGINLFLITESGGSVKERGSCSVNRCGQTFVLEENTNASVIIVY